MAARSSAAEWNPCLRPECKVPFSQPGNSDSPVHESNPMDIWIATSEGPCILVLTMKKKLLMTWLAEKKVIESSPVAPGPKPAAEEPPQVTE